MTWFSFHGGHSGEFCRHASGTLGEVLESARERGFSVYGVSEHAPRSRVEDLYPDEQDLAPGDLATIFEAYVERAGRLREELQGRLEVLVGFETEMVPPAGWLDCMKRIRESAAFDYTIGSVHHVGDLSIDMSPELTARAAERVGGAAALQRAYFEQVTEMTIELGPMIVGHFDLIRKFDGATPSFEPSVWTTIERALEAVRAAGALLDVNAAPVRRGLGPPYPLHDILERAQRLGIGVTLGDDSHGPADVGVGLEACVEAIASAGYREVSCLRRRDGAVLAESVPLGDVRPG
ncbi:MAG: histidinol-phosphatase [Myxococcota bacterium]